MKKCITLNTLGLVITVLFALSGFGQNNVTESVIATSDDPSSAKTVTIDELRAAEQQRELQLQRQQAGPDIRPGQSALFINKASWEVNYPVTAGSNVAVANLLVQCYGGNVRVNSLTLQSPSWNAGQTLRNVHYYFDGVQMGSPQNLIYRNGVYAARFNQNFVCQTNHAYILQIRADVSTIGIGRDFRIGVGQIDTVGNPLVNFLPAYGGAHLILGASHVAGTNVVDSNDDIYLITNEGTRRRYTSLEAFNSFSFNNITLVQPMNAADAALFIDDPILPQEGRLYQQWFGPDAGQAYLISGNKKHPFASTTILEAHGFSLTNIGAPVDLNEAIMGYTIASPNEMHPKGTIVNIGGLVFYNTEYSRMGFPSVDVFYSYGFSFARVVNATSGDAGLPADNDVMQARVPGQLTPR